MKKTLHKKLFKRLLTIVMCAVMMLCSNMIAFAGNMSSDEMIITQAVLMDTRLNLSGMKYEVVSLEPEHANMRSGQKEKVIMTQTSEGDIVNVTTIIPFKINAEGELINSFEYATNSAARSVTYPIDDLVDVTLTVTADVEKIPTFTMGDNGVEITVPIALYRHRGVTAYWNSNGSNITMNQMRVELISKGDLLYYERYITNGTDYEDAVYIHDYSLSSTINAGSIAAGVVRQAYNVMETQYALHPSKLLEHGGFIDIQLNYTINGAIRTVQKNYRIYNKEGIFDDLSGSFS